MTPCTPRLMLADDIIYLVEKVLSAWCQPSIYGYTLLLANRTSYSQKSSGIFMSNWGLGQIFYPNCNLMIVYRSIFFKSLLVLKHKFLCLIFDSSMINSPGISLLHLKAQYIRQKTISLVCCHRAVCDINIRVHNTLLWLLINLPLWQLTIECKLPVLS